jgi:hypothetical protein
MPPPSANPAPKNQERFVGIGAQGAAQRRDREMDKQGKIQHLLMTYLLEKGHIELTLPDGMVVEIGIVQENKYGELEVADDYSWVIATQKNRTVSMDSYNFGLRYLGDADKMLVEDDTVDQDGKSVKVFTAV